MADTAAETGADARGADFFISRAGADADFAAQIGHILEDAGYRVLLQQWDFGNKNFMGEMHDALASGARVIALMSPPFLESDHCLAEALNTVAHDPLNKQQRLIVMRVAECAPAGLLAAIPYLDLLRLRGGDPGVLREVVLAAVAPGRAKTAADVAQPYLRAPGTVLHERIQAVPNFTGRADDLARIAGALSGEDHHSVAITQAAVRGLGGVGKSTLAIQYGWAQRDQYAGVWWIDAEQNATLTDSLAGLGAVFMPQLAEIDDRAAAARESLRLVAEGGFAKPWLLIYDNVPGPKALDGLTPRAGAHVLITSRWRDWRGRAADVELEAFTRDEAVDFLLERTGRDDADGAARLAEALGDLPLALDHAAAFCVETGDSFDAYRDHLGEWLADAPEDADYPQTVFATFSLAIQDAAAKAPEAEKLMGLLAHFGAEAVPRWLIPEDVIAPVALSKAIGALSRVSLLTPVEGETGSAVRVHRLVQAVARARLGDQAGTYAAEAVRLLYRGYDFYTGTVGMQHRRGEWLPHALSILDHAPREGDAARSTIWVANFAGDFQVSRGALAAARAAYETGMEIARTRAGEAPDDLNWQRDLSVSLNRIGDVQVAQGDLARALASYRESRAIAERLAGADPGNAGWQRDLSVSLNKIGDVQVAQGDLAGALESYRESRAIAERLAQADPGNAEWQYDLGISNERIGDMLMAQGDLGGALERYNTKRDIISRLAKADQGNAGWQASHGKPRQARAGLCGDGGYPRGAEVVSCGPSHRRTAGRGVRASALGRVSAKFR